MLDFEVSVKNRLWRTTESVKGAVKRFFTTEDGDTNFISIIIVLMIVLGLALAFRNQINTLVKEWWANIQTDGGQINKIEISGGEGAGAGGASK